MNTDAFSQMMNLEEFRNNCLFMNRAVQVVGEDGILKKYPCIVVYEEETDIPIYYTGFEKYLVHLVMSERLSEKTLANRAYAVCHFLNHLLKETNINSLHECDLETIRGFLRSKRAGEDGTDYQKDTWLRYKDYLIDFLVMYHTYNKDILPFNYKGEELKAITILKEEFHHKRATIVHNASFHLQAPKTTQKKNRVLVEEYLKLLLHVAKKQEPDMALGIALQAYAGLREGEVVNISCDRIITRKKGFGVLSDILIDLTAKAPYFEHWEEKTDPGSIKRYRIQKVYPDFTDEVYELYLAHIARMKKRGLETGEDAPLFVNKQGNPMTVQTYSDRIKKIFYDHFLPSLKNSCKKQGMYADNAPYIEAYENEYPGAHMFRHWFTMYLLTRAKLTPAEIMKWRGDTNRNAMNDYIYENTDLAEAFRKSSYMFQSQILEDSDL